MIEALLKILAGLSLVAAGASLLALVLAAAGQAVMLWPHAVILIGCGVVALVGFFILQLTIQNRYGTKQMRKIGQAGAPKWLRWLCNGLSLAAFAFWFYLGYRRYEPPSGGVPSVIAGTFGMFVFPAFFLSFYSYLRLRPELRRRCSRGHEVPLEAAFCPQCGENVRPVV